MTVGEKPTWCPVLKRGDADSFTAPLFSLDCCLFGNDNASVGGDRPDALRGGILNLTFANLEATPER